MELETLAYLAERYPLLISKLHIPRLDAEHLARPSLVERLNHAVTRPVVAVTAPAGWGKTTLIASWAAQARQPIAWLSLDEGDNDLARFWCHVISALQQVRRGVGEAALVWFYAREALPIEARMTLLINDLSLANETFVLVIDDYHCVQAGAVHAALTFFVEHLPSNVRVILTSRSELPLPLARWRARRRLAEFHSQDLRFSVEECTEFLHSVMNLSLTPEQDAVLVERTEGWVAGLQLIALALQDRAHTDAFVKDLATRSRYIFDFLSEEVLDRQPLDLQTFLLKTSVLERLSSDLCAAVAEVGEGQRYLEMLEQHKLFIVALDDERRWFRYHHLFRDFLLNHLAKTQPDQLVELHHRAALAYITLGLPHDAVSHALAAQDYLLAGRIMLESANELWRREEFGTLRTWLEALPAALRDGHPDLCLFHAWALFALLEHGDIVPLLNRGEALLDQGVAPLASFSTDELRGILATIQAAISIPRQNLDAAVEFAQVALAHLPPEQKDWRFAALIAAGLAHHYRNETKPAVQVFGQAFAEAVEFKRGAGTFYGRAFAATCLAKLYVVQGHLHRAKELYEAALVLATGQTGKPLPAAARALSGLGELYYQWDDLELADKHFAMSLALSTQLTPATAPPYLALVRSAHARGDVCAAKAYLAQAHRLVERTGPNTYAEQVALCKVWLALQQRADRAVLAHWLREENLDVARPVAQREASYVMAARILIGRREYRAAQGLIEKLLVLAEEGGRDGVVIELLNLQAQALQRQGATARAIDILQRSIALAGPEGYVRLFVDEGEAMLDLLQRLVASTGATGYLSRLLGAFTKKEKTPDALNERELEVLRLLAAGMSNNEIAQALVITVGTVKWHTNHIYSKLGVKSRGQAVAKAQEFEWFSTSP